TYSDFNRGKYFSFLGVVDAGTSLSTRKAYLVRAHAMKTPRLARNAVIGIVSRYPGLSKVSVEMFSEMKLMTTSVGMRSPIDPKNSTNCLYQLGRDNCGRNHSINNRGGTRYLPPFERSI